jgi:hypothetical protein
MSTISSESKVAYIYDEATDTWHPVAGKINAAANYVWTGSNSFSGSFSVSQNLVARSGINNFQNAAARDAAIATPTNGLISFIRQDNSGNIINSLQYYYNGVWRPVDDSLRLSTKTENYTLQLSDGGSSINFSSSSTVVLTIPLNSSVPFQIGQRIDIIRSGSGLVHIVPDTGVTLNSRDGNRYLSSQYSAATITKTGTNTWILVGDLSAS